MRIYGYVREGKHSYLQSVITDGGQYHPPKLTVEGMVVSNRLEGVWFKEFNKAKASLLQYLRSEKAEIQAIINITKNQRTEDVV